MLRRTIRQRLAFTIAGAMMADCRTVLGRARIRSGLGAVRAFELLYGPRGWHGPTRALLEDRLRGGPVTPSPLAAGAVILGLDPGLANCGWGVVRWNPSRACAEHVAHGVIETEPGQVLPRVRAVSVAVQRLIEVYRPFAIGAEEWLAYENKRSVGHGTDTLRVVGAIEALAAVAGLSYLEFPATVLKKVLTGQGTGPKNKVAAAVRTRLRLDSVPKPDHASDALGIALVTLLDIRTSLRVSERGVDCLNNLGGK